MRAATQRRLIRQLEPVFFALWFALAIVVLLCCCSRIVERRVMVRFDPDPPVRCLLQKPPEQHPVTVAQKADAYDELERWVRLLVVPSCLEQR